MTDQLDALRAVLPDGRLSTDPDVMEAYRRDQTTVVTPGQPRCVVRAGSTRDVLVTLDWAQRHGVPVVPRGGGTSLAGGATAIDGCVVLSLARMDSIREVDPANELAVAEAGVLNADLDRAAAAHGLMYAPDPSSFEISTIGGNLATNAGGLRCVKYGVSRDAVLGLEVVLAGGRLLRTGRRTMKGVTGYDLTSLLVGSEVTLGIITSATLRLRPRPARYPPDRRGGLCRVRRGGQGGDRHPRRAAGAEPAGADGQRHPARYRRLEGDRLRRWRAGAADRPG